MLTTIKDNLAVQKIIDEHDIVKFRKYINKKYSGFDDDDCARTLAKAIVGILNKELSFFGEDHRTDLSKKIFSNALRKDEFIITKYDVFLAGIEKAVYDNHLIEPLCTWVNAHKDDEVLIKILLNTLSGFQTHVSDDGLADENYLQKLILKTLELISLAQAESEVNEKISALNDSLSLKNKVYDTDAVAAKKPRRKQPQKLNIFSVYPVRKKEVPAVFSNENEAAEKKGTLDLHKPLFGRCLENVKIIYQKIHGYRFSQMAALGLIVLFLLLPLSLFFKWINSFNYSDLPVKNVNAQDVVAISTNYDIPFAYRYKQIDQDLLRNYLQNKKSVLSSEPYFSAILKTAEKYDLNPLLLFAITGQEQNFVPVDGADALRIANNPFNVYHSWQKFNTDISQSTEIAAVTILNLSKNRPAETDFLKWLNLEYAEDQKWHEGVGYFMRDMKHTEE
ncbi:MAG: hypothetical protein LBR98_02305 [Syntrophomonadaceae bacterium]|nr:hypothetical protein [Syntrophomonadaceae bacterium]